MTQSNSYVTKARESGNPTILTEAKTLARAADSIVALSGGKLSKNSVLNALASAICGSKHNWGFLKSAQGTVQDSRVTMPDQAPAPARPRPTHFRDLLAEDLFEVRLPNGRPGYVPMARLTPRTDGGIDITCVSWGSAYEPKQDALLVDTTLTLSAEACRDIVQNWPTPRSLSRDISWGGEMVGFHATLSETHGHLSILIGPGWCIVDAEKLFALVKAQAT